MLDFKKRRGRGSKYAQNRRLICLYSYTFEGQWWTLDQRQAGPPAGSPLRRH
jgi:hypothetical protein